MFFLELSLFFVFPLLVFWLYPLLVPYRFGVMTIVFVYALVFLHHQGILFRLDKCFASSTYEAFREVIPLTLLAILVIELSLFIKPSFLAVGNLALSIGFTSPLLALFLYSLVSVPVQEVLFRLYLISRLETLFASRNFVILISTMVFGLAHLPLRNPFLIFGTFCLGYFWTVHYLRYRSFLALFFSHAVTGGLLMYHLYFVH